MKYAAVLLVCLLTLPVFAGGNNGINLRKFAIGIQLGGNMSIFRGMHYQYADYSDSAMFAQLEYKKEMYMKFGYLGGVSLVYKFNEKLHLNTQASFTQIGTRESHVINGSASYVNDEHHYYGKRRLFYIDNPWMFKYYTSLPLGFHFNYGGYWRYLLFATQVSKYKGHVEDPDVISEFNTLAGDYSFKQKSSSTGAYDKIDYGVMCGIGLMAPISVAHDLELNLNYYHGLHTVCIDPYGLPKRKNSVITLTLELFFNKTSEYGKFRNDCPKVKARNK